MLDRLRACFAELREAQPGPGGRHDPAEILIIALCSVLSGGETAVDMAIYGRAKREFLAGFLELKHGIPSHDTFSRVFRRLDPERLRACFRRVAAASLERHGRVIAIDGKAARGQPLHMVSAWDCERQQVLAQLAVDAKTAETRAIDDLLRQLPLDGAVVTADALNCRPDIARRILDQGGDYVLTLKGNRGGLYACVSRHLDDLRPDGAAIDITVSREHSRQETRTSLVSAEIDWLEPRYRWPGLAAVGKVVRTRGPIDPLAGDESIETAYYLLSTPLPVRRFAAVVRAHWGVENCLHRPLNAVMNEDLARSRCDNSPYNLAILRHLALNVMRKDASDLSLRARFNLAGWQDAYMAQLLAGAETELAATRAAPLQPGAALRG